MELKEFQGLALRTESQIQGIQLNRDNLITLLKVVVAVTEILDGIKKAAFYNKTAKLEDNLLPHLNTLLTLVQSLQWNATGRGPVGAIMDAEETLGNVDPRVFHGILGIITESGELASALLKSVEDPNHVVDAVNIQEEMSDIAWYKAILHDTLGLDWNQGLINVINKLRIRYPDKYSDDAADNRNLEAERAALEVGNGNCLQDFISGKHDPVPSNTIVDVQAREVRTGEIRYYLDGVLIGSSPLEAGYRHLTTVLSRTNALGVVDETIQNDWIKAKQ